MDELTQQDVLIIEFAVDKLDKKESQKLIKELATLKEKMSKIIKLQEIKSEKW